MLKNQGAPLIWVIKQTFYTLIIINESLLKSWKGSTIRCGMLLKLSGPKQQQMLQGISFEISNFLTICWISIITTFWKSYGHAASNAINFGKYIKI